MLFRKERGPSLPWDDTAANALEHALQQTPIPALVRGTVKSELVKAAEAHAREHGRGTVTAEDLMNGLLAKIPAAMRTKVEQALQQGPDALGKLQDELK